MLHSRTAVACAVLAMGPVLASYSPVSRAAPTESASPTANELVDAALASQLDGNTQRRDALLEQALALDSDFARARWHLGFVRWDDQWLTALDVAQRAAGDVRLSEYRKRRDAMIDTADAHRELARWCGKTRLLDEQRLHWAKVLEFERSDPEALAALDLTWHEGRLLTRDQIVAEKRRSAERMRAFYHWRPKLMKWREAIEHGTATGHDAALRKLAALDDPDAIGALELIFGAAGKGETGKRLGLVLVETLDRLPHQEATGALLRRAVYDPSTDVALAAADALAKRPLHSYVPQLLATMPSQLVSRFHVTVMPGGTVVHEHELQLETRQGTYSLTYESLVHPTNVAMASLVTPAALAGEQAKAATIESSVAAELAARDALGKRIQLVLKRATGFDDVEDPELWIRQYAEYYGWTAPEKSNNLRRQQVWDYRTYFPVAARSRDYDSQRRSSTTSTPATPRTTAAFSPQPESAPTIGVRGVGFPGECFAAGTPVITIRGPRPIETIKPGDRVLAQDVDTGELAYKTVGNRTLRQSVKLLAIRAGSETIAATPGHPFFVAGKGWQVARHLDVGDRLCGLSGMTRVEYVEELPRGEVYNLVVGDFNTFFVGDGRLLVHDDMALGATTALVPGLTLRAASR